MSRYYFHFREGPEFTRDALGIELPDVENAYCEAFRTAQQMWSELLRRRADPLTCGFEITDDDGTLLFALPFAEVLHWAQRKRKARPSARAYADTLVQLTGRCHKANRLVDDIAQEVETAKASLNDLRALLGEVNNLSLR